MKLVTVNVQNYKSVRNSGDFAIGDVTCLVGKNEAGKTSILKALYKLNPVIAKDERFNPTHDYPRAQVEEYLQSLEAMT